MGASQWRVMGFVRIIEARRLIPMSFLRLWESGANDQTQVF